MELAAAPGLHFILSLYIRSNQRVLHLGSKIAALLLYFPRTPWESNFRLQGQYYATESRPTVDGSCCCLVLPLNLSHGTPAGRYEARGSSIRNTRVTNHIGGLASQFINHSWQRCGSSGARPTGRPEQWRSNRSVIHSFVGGGDFIAMERIQTARFSTARRFIRTKGLAGSRRITRDCKRAPGSALFGDAANHGDSWSPPIIGCICQQFSQSRSILLPYGQFASCASKVISQLGLFGSNHHTPLQGWLRHHLRPLHHPRRCASPSPRTGPDSEKQARSFVATRKSLRPRRTTLIFALTVPTGLKVTVLIVPVNLVDSYAQDRTQRHGRSLARRN